MIYSTAVDQEYIDPDQLYQLIKTTKNPQDLVIIDVRDDDYDGGHIRDSWHIPVTEFKQVFPTVLSKLQAQGTKKVVIHCSLSKQRGPSSALRFRRFLNEELASSDAPQSVKDYISQLSVAVLKGGFVAWQRKYGTDESVTEDYDAEEYYGLAY